MDRRRDLLSAEGCGGGVDSASPGPPALPGRPSVATILVPSSPRESPAWLLPTREASEPSDGCHDRKCPPAQQTQTAPPFPAAPSPRAGPAGPGSPDSRGRRNRLGRPISRPLSPALAAAPPPLGTADSKRIQKERGTLTASLGPPPCSGIRKTSARTPKAPNPREIAPHHGRKIPRHPLGAAVQTQSPRRQVPGHTITLKLWGRGTGICRQIPPPKNTQFVVMEVLLLYSCKAAFPGGLARASRASSARGPARPCPGAPASRAPTLRAAGDAVARPLPRGAPPRQSTHLGRAALPAGLRRAR